MAETPQIRTALLFSDRNMTVFCDDWPMEKIQREREEADRNEHRDKWTKVVKVRIEVTEVVFDPAANTAPEPTEIELLRAEIAALKSKSDVATQIPGVRP